MTAVSGFGQPLKHHQQQPVRQARDGVEAGRQSVDPVGAVVAGDRQLDLDLVYICTPWDYPQDPDLFGKLPGVGVYIRAAVTSIAFNRPLPAVDGNVKRVLARLMRIDEPVNRSASHRRFEDSAQALLDRAHASLQPAEAGIHRLDNPADQPVEIFPHLRVHAPT